MSYSFDYVAENPSSTPSRHPYEYMDESKTNSLLLCCKCEKPFVDPVTDRNQQRGCRLCLSDSSPLTDIREWIVLEMLNSLLVKCTRCGQKDIPRGKLAEHENRSCRRATVACKNADIKCTWRDAREHLDEHVAQCVFGPLRPALADILTENQQLQERIAKLEDLVNELRENQ